MFTFTFQIENWVVLRRSSATEFQWDGGRRRCCVRNGGQRFTLNSSNSKLLDPGRSYIVIAIQSNMHYYTTITLQTWNCRNNYYAITHPLAVFLQTRDGGKLLLFLEKGQALSVMIDGQNINFENRATFQKAYSYPNRLTPQYTCWLEIKQSA